MRMHVRSAVCLASILTYAGFGAATAVAQTPAAAMTPAAVATTKILVKILGRVKAPGEYTFVDGTRLSDAVAAAGWNEVDTLNARAGIPVDAIGCTRGGADLHRVILVRTVEGSKTAGYQIDVATALRTKDLRNDPLLRQDDKIYVTECRPLGLPIPIAL